MQDIEATLELGASLSELFRRGEIVILAAADAKAQRKPTIRERVYTGSLLGKHADTAERQKQNGWHESDALCDGRGCRERNHGLVVLLNDSIDNAQARERTSVGSRRPLDDPLASDTCDSGRQSNANLHINFTSRQPNRLDNPVWIVPPRILVQVIHQDRSSDRSVE
jgi:hypothetical protein